MAGALAEAEAVCERVRQATARFEVTWSLRRDPDPVPETAEVVVALARLLADRTGGLALVNGHRLLDPAAAPFGQLFPA